MSKAMIGTLLTGAAVASIVAMSAFAQRPDRRVHPLYETPRPIPEAPAQRANRRVRPAHEAARPAPVAPQVITETPVAPVKPGAPPGIVVKFHHPRVPPPPVDLTYKGTDIGPDPEAEDAELKLQQTIAARLARLDFVPAQRRNHFRWLDVPSVRVIGWSGTIQKMSQGPNGWLVKVRMMPYVRTLGGRNLVTADHTMEIYNYKNGALDFVGLTVPQMNLRGFLNGSP